MIGCEDRLRNDVLCVGWGVKLYSLTHFAGDFVVVIDQSDEESYSRATACLLELIMLQPGVLHRPLDIFCSSGIDIVLSSLCNASC